MQPGCLDLTFQDERRAARVLSQRHRAQERQDALFEMLKKPMDLLLVVGGYNSSNTAHLVEIAEPEVSTFFIRSAACIRSLEEIVHYDLHRREEVTSSGAEWLDLEKSVTVGITAGASCPNNLIEETIFKVFELRGVPRDVEQAREDLLGEESESDFFLLMRAWRYAERERFDLEACRRLGIHAQAARQVPRTSPGHRAGGRTTRQRA